MIRTVRRQLVAGTLLASVVTIAAVGVVTLLLVDTYFQRQEEAYLRDRAAAVLPLLQQSLQYSAPEELQRLVALTGLMADVRLRLLTLDGIPVADSGPRAALSLFGDDAQPGDAYAFGLVVGSDGAVRQIGPPLSGVLAVPAGGGAGPILDPPLELDADTPITAISDERLRLPLEQRGQRVGYLELSEGPAAGSGIVRAVRVALLGGSAVALLLAVAAGRFSARQVTRPLDELEQAVEAIAGGDLAHRAPRSRLHEFDRLATRFNAMAGQLSGTITRLEEERTVLRRMTADASHELRTPLTALQTFLALLADQVRDPAAADLVADSAVQAQQLERLTGNLLDLSRLEARLAGTALEPGDLRNVVAAAVHRVTPLAAERPLRLETVLPAAATTVPHDPLALEQALVNLLRNAITHAPPDSRVTVRLTAREETVRLAVSDQGRGIPPEQLPRLFDRFYRGPEERQPGSGLGLAIVREVARIHGGTVEVSSAPGAGSTFTLTLPRHTA